MNILSKIERKSIFLITGLFVIVVLITLANWGVTIRSTDPQIKVVPISMFIVRIFFGGVHLDDPGLLVGLLLIVSIWFALNAPVRLLHITGATITILGSFSFWQQWHWGGVYGIDLYWGINGDFYFQDNGGVLLIILSLITGWLTLTSPNFLRIPMVLGIVGSIGLVCLSIYHITFFTMWQTGLRIEPEFGLIMLLLGSLFMLYSSIGKYQVRREANAIHVMHSKQSRI